MERRSTPVGVAPRTFTGECTGRRLTANQPPPQPSGIPSSRRALRLPVTMSRHLRGTWPYATKRQGSLTPPHREAIRLHGRPGIPAAALHALTRLNVTAALTRRVIWRRGRRLCVPRLFRRSGACSEFSVVRRFRQQPFQRMGSKGDGGIHIGREACRLARSIASPGEQTMLSDQS
jgi:hypothetical protein